MAKNQAPRVIKVIPGQSATEGKAFKFQVASGTFSDPENLRLTYTATLSTGKALPSWLSFNASTLTFTGTPPANSADISVTVTATDPGKLSASTSFAITTPPANLPPRSKTISGQSARETVPFTFTIPSGTFTDPEGQALTYTAALSDGKALPSWLSFNASTLTFSGTPPSNSADITVTVTATDPGKLSASTSFAIATPSGNLPPRSKTISNQSAKESVPFKFTIPSGTFTDPEGQTLTYTATLSNGNALPSWLSFSASTLTFSGTPPNNSGDVVVTVTATDPGKLSAQSAFKILTPANQAPRTGKPISDQSAPEGRDFTFTIPNDTFIDPEKQAFTYMATLVNGRPLPTWLTLDTKTGTFRGNPPTNASDLDVRVTAIDSAGLKAQASFKISTPTAQTATEGKDFTFKIPDSTFANPGKQALTYKATLVDGTAWPTWLAFDAKTGIFSGKPPIDAADLDVRVTATSSVGFQAQAIFRINTPAFQIPTDYVKEGLTTPKTFEVPAEAFYGFSGTGITFTATLADDKGSSLPSWLSFDNKSMKFSANPPANTEDVTIRITATGPNNITKSKSFTLYTANTKEVGAWWADKSDATAEQFSKEIISTRRVPDKTNITYSFMTASPTGTYAPKNDEATGFVALTDGSNGSVNLQGAATRALNAWASIADITFTQAKAGDAGFLEIGASKTTKGNGTYTTPYSNNTDHKTTHAAIWLNPNWPTYTQVGNGQRGYSTLIHEIGHAIGLNHPGNYNADNTNDLWGSRTYGNDDRQHSIMSYFQSPSYDSVSWFPESPMPMDIYAIQKMYGANFNTNSGDDTYVFNKLEHPMKTIWDGGGTDTIDASAFSMNQKIDLTPGSFSSIGLAQDGTTPAVNNIALAYGIKNSKGDIANYIETAIGGSGNDTIIGNDANNILKGGDGNDTIIGGAGYDIIDGGNGENIAILIGTRSEYSATRTSNGSYITDKVANRDGIDMLLNIKYLKFSDQQITASSFFAAPSLAAADGAAGLSEDPTLESAPILYPTVQAADVGSLKAGAPANGGSPAAARATTGFNPYAYLALNPDLFAAFGADPVMALAHYVQTGYAENRATLGFDPYSYLALNPDLYAAFGNNFNLAIQHYISSGEAEGRPATGFDPYAYLALNPELFAAFGANANQAVAHYARFGINEDRATLGFDPFAYLALNGDLYSLYGGDVSKAIQHYISSGAEEGRAASGFDPYAYLALNPDLYRAFGVDPLKAVAHYVQFGSADAAAGGVPSPVPAALGGTATDEAAVLANLQSATEFGQPEIAGAAPALNASLTASILSEANAAAPLPEWSAGQAGSPLEMAALSDPLPWWERQQGSGTAALAAWSGGGA